MIKDVSKRTYFVKNKVESIAGISNVNLLKLVFLGQIFLLTYFLKRNFYSRVGKKALSY